MSEAMIRWRAWMGGVRLKAVSGIAIILGGIILHAMGLMDDRRSIGALPKLAIQVVIALVLTAGFGIRILDTLGAPLAILLTTLWIVTLTNAFNFLDNMDGLSAGVAFLTATILAVTSFRAGQVFVPCTLMLVAGAVLGFLVFNFPPANIFMGDAGSLVVGYMLAVLTVLITFYDPEQGRTPFGVLVPLVVFAIPLYDLLSVTWHRLRSGRSIFSADRGHFSHRLVNLGMAPTMAVLTIYLATLATSLPAMLLPQLGWAGAILILGQCLCVIAIIAILETRHER
jgi:UDP-GlcNAc:undecaprenyl-phosphate GlcNAc-1-phosphate transferase